jgi:hypothetical protein
VARLGIDVQDEAAVRRNQLARSHDPRGEALEIRVEARPAIVERGRELALDPAGARAASPSDLFVLSAGQKWRIQVSERDGRTDAFLQRLERE